MKAERWEVARVRKVQQALRVSNEEFLLRVGGQACPTRTREGT